MFNPDTNIYLSLLQDFDLIQEDEGPVKILPREETCRKKYYQQIAVVVKGYDGETYNCLGRMGSVSE